MKKRGSLFYIIDSFIAAAIITLTLVIIIASYSAQSSPDIVYDSLEDYINFFENIELRNAPGTTARAILNEDLISDPKMNIFEAVAELYATGYVDNASMLIEEITNLTLEVQFGTSFNITDINGEENIYERYAGRKENSDIFLNRKINTYVLREGRLKVIDIANPPSIPIIECLDRHLECLSSQIECPPASPKTVGFYPGCVYGVLGWSLPAGCTVKKVSCGETLQTEIFGPYDIEVSIWV